MLDLPTTSRIAAAAHLDRARALGWLRAAKGASLDVDGDDGNGKHDVPVTAVDKRINQQGTLRHGNMEKLVLCLARIETDRRAPATVK